jgi:nicotinamidase/pyrazinamidase
MKRLLWDVDTQIDFIESDGKLAVPDADAVVPAMARLVEWARREDIPHVASADDHELTDPEISESPDYADTFPPHCLRGTRGARKIPETEQEEPVPLGLGPVPDLYLEGREFLLLKKSFDVFTNPNTERLLDRLGPDEIVVFGVATDVCDDAAIRGFLARGLKVRFVEDAARGLDDERVAVSTTFWREQGVEFTTAEEAIATF